jgi:hypothetical protein
MATHGGVIGCGMIEFPILEPERAFIQALMAYQPPKGRKARRKGRWQFLTPEQKFYARQRKLRRILAARLKERLI